MFTRALSLPADGLILDLEDAVAPDRKAATRGVVREWLARDDLGGRGRRGGMNPVATGPGPGDLEGTIERRARRDGGPQPRRRGGNPVSARHLDRLGREQGTPNGPPGGS